MNPSNMPPGPTKVAVVTGVSKGIGYEISGLLLKHGLKVYGLSRTKPDFVSPAFVWLQCDLSQEESIKSALKQITEPQIDLLVCNAGTATVELAANVSQESFKATYRLNVLAPMLVVRELYYKLHVANIINISSVSDRLMEKGYSLYSSSKAANTRYFETLALEMIGANIYSLLPSSVDTPLLRQLEHNNPNYKWENTIQSWQVAMAVYKVFRQELPLPSGANIIVVNNALEDHAKSVEKLYIFNVDTQRLSQPIEMA